MYCFIVNRVSGNGKALKIWSHIKQKVEELDLNYCVHFTQRAKHATQIVQEHISGNEATVIIVVGGDGTVHEAINGLIGSTIPLGIIPAGSGNDFCRALGIPINFDQALERILNDECMTIDVGQINTSYFASVAGVGFDGQVAKATNQSKFKKKH